MKGYLFALVAIAVVAGCDSSPPETTDAYARRIIDSYGLQNVLPFGGPNDLKAVANFSIRGWISIVFCRKPPVTVNEIDDIPAAPTSVYLPTLNVGGPSGGVLEIQLDNAHSWTRKEKNGTDITVVYDYALPNVYLTIKIPD